MFLKLLAFGPAYFQSWRNLFDFILSFPTVAYAISGLIILLMPDTEKLYIKVNNTYNYSCTITVILNFIRYTDVLFCSLHFYSKTNHYYGEICKCMDENVKTFK